MELIFVFIYWSLPIFVCWALRAMKPCANADAPPMAYVYFSFIHNQITFSFPLFVMSTLLFSFEEQMLFFNHLCEIIQIKKVYKIELWRKNFKKTKKKKKKKKKSSHSY